MEPTAAEIRVLGALVEKQRTTPDHYPLTLNALRQACNQSTNRDPVVDYDDATIRDALQRLRQRGWARYASGPGSRAAKYRHLFDDALGLGADEVAVLTVLMLRGPQTPGELKSRTERMHAFGDLGEIEDTLERLIGRELAARIGRRPGQKEDRYEHRLGGGADGPAPAEPPAAEPVPAPADGGLEARVAELETAVEELRDRVAELAGRPAPEG